MTLNKDELLRELSLLYDFTDEIDSECDEYISEFPKSLPYYKDLADALESLQSIATDVGAIIEAIQNELEKEEDKK